MKMAAVARLHTNTPWSRRIQLISWVALCQAVAGPSTSLTPRHIRIVLWAPMPCPSTTRSSHQQVADPLVNLTPIHWWSPTRSPSMPSLFPSSSLGRIDDKAQEKWASTHCLDGWFRSAMCTCSLLFRARTTISNSGSSPACLLPLGVPQH